MHRKRYIQSWFVAQSGHGPIPCAYLPPGDSCNGGPLFLRPICISLPGFPFQGLVWAAYTITELRKISLSEGPALALFMKPCRLILFNLLHNILQPIIQTT